MILGLGTDIVDVARIERELELDEESVRASLFTTNELSNRGPRPAERLARAFAAKEAFFKALGHHWQGGLAWRDVELGEREAVGPELQLTGAAQAAAARMGVRRIHVTVSSGARLAMASVVLDSEHDATPDATERES